MSVVRNKPTKVEYQELAEFRYRLRRFLHFSELAATNAGITPSQHQLLLSIAGFPDRDWMTPTEIAERLCVRHHSALGLIQRCEKLGLVKRFNNPSDRRSVCIELTVNGLAILDKLTMEHQAELRRLGLSNTHFLGETVSVFGEDGNGTKENIETDFY